MELHICYIVIYIIYKRQYAACQKKSKRFMMSNRSGIRLSIYTIPLVWPKSKLTANLIVNVNWFFLKKIIATPYVTVKLQGKK